MAIFGRYQTVRELYRSGFTVLYSGRTSASSEAHYAIKVFQPSPLLLETDQVKTESDLFLNSARVQQKTAASGAQYWAPIHKCDSIPDGAFYATDRYDRSLQQLIDTNISLTTQAFLKIIESIAQGLVELKKACGRPHGNLKATNILIAEKEEISQTKIVLSDPLPDEHIDTEVHWDSDLREIAEFIYQLVLHRPSPSVDGWQAPDSKEWTKFGKQAQELRNLCNRLLVAHMKPGTMTVEILIRELDRFKKIKPVFSTRRLLIAAVLVVIAGVAIICLKSVILPAKAAKLEDWNRLLTEYEDWVNGLRGDLIGPNSNQREQRWKNNPHLGAIIVENIINNKKASFPDKVAADNDFRAKDLRTMITAQEDMDKYDITLSKTNAALKAVEIIKYFFVPESDPNSFRFYDPNLSQDKQEYQRWPLLVQTQQVSEVLSNRGWQRSATYLENLVNDIKPDPNIAENVDKILELQPTLDNIKAHWKEIENNETIIANSGDPFLSGFSDYIKREPVLALDKATNADVNNVGKILSDELQNREQLSRELAESINNNWQKLKENQEIIKDTGNPTLVKVPDYIQSQLASVDLDILSEKLQEMSSSARMLSDFVKDNWQKLKENQDKIIDAGDPILNKFPDYLNSKLDAAHSEILNGKADLDILLSELENVNNLAETLAKFNWQKVDKESFLNVHRNDSEETPTEKTFTERLDIVKTYSYLVPDPRDKLYELVEQTRIHIKQAQEHNPQPAGDCANNLNKLQPNIIELQGFIGIKKEEDQIDKKINDIQPAIIKINETAISLIETPEDWLQRISEDSRIASSEVLNGKWIELRDKVIKGHTAGELTKDKTLYQEFRERVKGTKESLVKLDEVLTRELPSQIDTELKEIGWNKILKGFYDEERKNTIKHIVENIRLKDEIPDINAPSFKQFSQMQFSRLQQLQVDLGGILVAFNKIEDGLDLCYLLDHKLPETTQTIRSLWENWNDRDILKDPSIKAAIAELTQRIIDLEEIEQSDNRDTLGRIASDTNSQTEAIYAAWARLGEVEVIDLPWPNTDTEWAREKEIQDLLRTKLQTIKGQKRVFELKNLLDDVSIKREKIFRGANIKRYKAVVKNKSSADPILVEFEALEPFDADADLSEVMDFENLAKVLAEFVADSNWPEEFRTDLFREKSNVHKSNESVTMSNVGTIIRTWRKEVEYYRKLKPENILRNKYSWDEKMDKIDGLLAKELARKQAGESFNELKTLKSEFDTLKLTIKDLQSLPAINMYKDQIDKSGDYWEQLLEIERGLKPEYCNRIELENEQIIFASNNLHPKFEPILDADNKMTITLKGGWEDIRKAVNQKQKEWLDFFYIIDMNDTKNTGWPRYIRSTMDPSVILRFIPAGPGNPEPFYMATQEVSNAQYRLYLEKISAVKPRIIGMLNLFKDQSNNELIRSGKYDDPARACKITSNGKSFSVTQGNEDIPVTWVIYSGAQSYAQWLNGQLPTVSQHKYACEAQDSIPPWANNQEIPIYAHVRGGDWKTIAEEYNNTLINSDELRTLIANRIPAPVGAKPEDFIPQKTTLDSTQTAHEEKKYGSPWPVDHAESTNDWGLYDMIGNVWEWCQNGTQSVICGGSCLAPKKYVLLTDLSNYSVEFSKTACDVGFRIVVPAK